MPYFVHRPSPICFCMNGFSNNAIQDISTIKQNWFVFYCFLYMFSPSLTSKKSNEIFQGGLSSIKNAATSMAKKLDEFKDAISANNTPIKSASLDRGYNRSEDNLDIGSPTYTPATSHSRRISSDVDLWSRLSDSRKSSSNNLLFLGELAKQQTTYHSEAMHPQVSLEHRYNAKSDVEIQLSSCSQCHNCLELMYDKDIMAGWSAEDSNLNTTCHKCKRATVPLLNIIITSMDLAQSNEKQTNQISVPYLNPLVLRKELENILTQYGDDVLCKSKFVDDHSIIYWNLVWFMERIAVQTHLSSLFFHKSVSQNRYKNRNRPNIHKF